jgi:ATP dependent DNA ligase domain
VSTLKRSWWSGWRRCPQGNAQGLAPLRPKAGPLNIGGHQVSVLCYRSYMPLIQSPFVNDKLITRRGHGEWRFAGAIREHGLEGVVAKRVNSLYEPGKRSGSWVKRSCKQSCQFVVVGYRPAGKSFSVLLVGKFDTGKLRFAGKLRHGFDTPSRAFHPSGHHSVLAAPPSHNAKPVVRFSNLPK